MSVNSVAHESTSIDIQSTDKSQTDANNKEVKDTVHGGDRENEITGDNLIQSVNTLISAHATEAEYIDLINDSSLNPYPLLEIPEDLDKDSTKDKPDQNQKNNVENHAEGSEIKDEPVYIDVLNDKDIHPYPQPDLPDNVSIYDELFEMPEVEWPKAKRYFSLYLGRRTVYIIVSIALLASTLTATFGIPYLIDYSNTGKGAIIFYQEGGPSVRDGRSAIFSGPPLCLRQKILVPPFAYGKNFWSPPLTS